MEKMKGVIVAMTTPFKGSGAIDFDTIGRNTEFLVDKGIKFLYPCGTTSEMLLLSTEERKLFAETVLDAARGKADVFVQCGSTTESDTKTLIRHAKKIGAKGVGVVTPVFFDLTQKELLDFYKEVSEEAGDGFPVYLYNIPQCSGNDILASTCKDIAKSCKNVVGIKYSWNNPDRISQYLAINNYDFSVIIGLERHFLSNLALGCDGVVSGCSNAFPEIFIAMFNAYQERRLVDALLLQRRIDKLVLALTANKSIARVKAAQMMRGFGKGYMRHPLQSLTKEEFKELEFLLKDFY